MRKPRSLSRNSFVFPSEFDWLLYQTGTTNARAARLLCRHVRSIEDWRAGRRPVPRWAFELVRLWSMELPQVVRVKHAHHAWIDWRIYCGDRAANAARFMQARRPVRRVAGAGGHAVPDRPGAGQAAVPPGEHARPPPLVPVARCRRARMRAEAWRAAPRRQAQPAG